MGLRALRARRSRPARLSLLPAALQIRTLAADDGALLRELRLRALTESPDAFGSALADERDLSEVEWERRAADDDAVIFVAELSAEPVGMAGANVFDPDRGIVGLWGMWVDPAARGTGAGAALVGAVRDWAADRGARFVRAGVVSGDGGASGFYERLGFVAIGNERRLRRDPDVAWWEMIRPA